jgi:hypothetical protein
LIVSASHFLASSTVMAEAPLVIDLAVAKSKAADMSFGLIIAYSLSANRCPDRLAWRLDDKMPAKARHTADQCPTTCGYLISKRHLGCGA